MKFSLALAITGAFVLCINLAKAIPVTELRQAAFFAHNIDMAEPYMFDSGGQGKPQLSDILGKEKSASIALDAILRSEALVRAISGASADFTDGLTLLLPTNSAFQSLDSIPDDLELVMKRHFIPQVITSQRMEQGTTVFAYERVASLRFSAMHGKVYVQADKRPPVEVKGAGTHASSGTYFLVDQLFV